MALVKAKGVVRKVFEDKANGLDCAVLGPDEIARIAIERTAKGLSLWTVKFNSNLKVDGGEFRAAAIPIILDSGVGIAALEGKEVECTVRFGRGAASEQAFVADIDELDM